MQPIAGLPGGDKQASGAVLTGITGALANTQVFSLCSTRELRKVAKVAKVSTIAKGTQLMTQGDDGDAMFVLLSGIARVSRNGRKVAQLGAGDVAGELAVLKRTSRSATVEAETELEVAELSRRAVSRLVSDVPAFSLKLLEAMAGRVIELDQKAYP